MIVKPHGDAVLLIAQPDHAALAGRLMGHWDAGGLPHSPRRREILLAVSEHDNGWREADAAPFVDAAGRVLDFVNLPVIVRQGVWPRGVDRLAHTPYTAALVAHHAWYVYSRFRSDAAWTPFFEHMQTIRDRHLAASGVPFDTLLNDYAFVRLGDLASLTFCGAWTGARTDIGDYSMWMDGPDLIVTPDPFDGRRVPMEIAGVELQAAPFGSPADARAAFAAAPRRILTGHARGAAAH